MLFRKKLGFGHFFDPKFWARFSAIFRKPIFAVQTHSVSIGFRKEFALAALALGWAPGRAFAKSVGPWAEGQRTQLRNP